MNAALIQEVLNKQQAILNAIGVKNEIHVGAGIFFLSVDKGNAAPIRKAFKNKIGTVTEVRGNEMVAFVWIDDSIAMSKKEIKDYVMAA